MVQEDTMNELDEQAWERWVAFRKVIRKPIKPISEHAAKLKLARFGDDQAAVVDQSIANGWQGLFEIKKAAPRPGERVEKTDKQKAADVARHAEQDEWAAKAWGKQEPTPINRLKLCDAYLARLTFSDDKDAIERLRDAAAAALRIADAIEVLNDPHLVGMVRQLFGERGLGRLRNR
jgi:crotonobetainyl-CoA:carnitine CoA-transferase CaiB-like acyl-CoA transferase